MPTDTTYDNFFNDIAEAIRLHSTDENISSEIESAVLRVISKYSAIPHEPKENTDA